jgi:hypothetical protein
MKFSFIEQPQQNIEPFQITKSSCSIENQVNIEFNQLFDSLSSLFVRRIIF